jgi:hypothetical protein
LVVILLLLAVWGGVGAWWLLSRPESRSSDSIGTFRQQLTVLERTGPTSVSPAFRMRNSQTGVYGASAVSFAPLAAVAPRAVPVPVSRRRQVQKRRRDVFYGLLVAMVGAAGLGFLPGLSVMWWLSVLLAVALMVYVVVLVQLRAATVDRVARVPTIGYPPPSAFGSYAEPEAPYLLRRSAN